MAEIKGSLFRASNRPRYVTSFVCGLVARICFVQRMSATNAATNAIAVAKTGKMTFRPFAGCFIFLG
jgi:hypothetical protein